MSSNQGFSNQEKVGGSQYQTIGPVGSSKMGADVSNKVAYLVNGNTPLVIVSAELLATDNRFVVLEITAHGLSVGSMLRFLDAPNDGIELDVKQVIDVDHVAVAKVVSFTIPAASDEVNHLRYISQLADSSGNATFNQGPTEIIYNGVETQVAVDTGTPANSVGMPVWVLDASGNILGGLATEATQLLNLAELQDVNTELDAQTVLLTSLDGKDFATETTLAAILADTTSLDGKDFATETTLAAVLADTTAIAAVDFATETTLAAILALDFATETTLAAILADTTSLDAKDFATETTLAAVLADTNALAAVDFATETTLAAILALDFATETTLASVLADTTALLALDYATETTLALVLAELQDLNGNPGGNGGSLDNSTVSTSAATLTAPANTIGFILSNQDAGNDLYFAVGATAANDGTSGQKLEPSRDTGYVPVGANVSIIGSAAGVRYNMQWITRS